MSVGGSIERAALPRRIRSSHRRRLLLHLSEGSGTVSNLARRTGLRTPHASSELGRMRNDGFVMSDGEAGARGALQHLSESGWTRLEEDERARLADLRSSEAPVGSVGVLLARDGAELLIGVVEEPEGAYIAIPSVLQTKSPVLVEEVGAEYEDIATGSVWDGSERSAASDRDLVARWALAEIREPKPRFHDPITLERMAAPLSDDPQSLEAWQSGPRPLGLLRARLVDPLAPTSLAVGSWFTSPGSESVFEPLPYDRDPIGWVLGTIIPGSADVRPGSGIVAVVDDRLAVAAVAEVSNKGALVMVEGERNEPLGPIPAEVLEPWIELVHPRLGSVARRRRLLAVQATALEIGGPSRRELPDATLKRLRQDWGDRRFVERSSPDRIDLRGLSDTAKNALLRWSLELDPRRLLVVQVSATTPTVLVRRLCRSERLRVLISPVSPPPGSEIAELRPDRIHSLPWMRLSTLHAASFPIRLGSGRDPGRVLPPPDWIPPRRIADVDDAASFARSTIGDVEVRHPSEDVDERVWMWRGLNFWPYGDEAFANAAEAEHPLAAWIASTEVERWPRWQRLRSRLNRRWLRLLSPSEIPIESIAGLVEGAPADWVAAAAQILAGRLREDSLFGDYLRRLAMMENDDASRGWLASIMIAECSWLPHNQRESLARWGMDAWMAAPPPRSSATVVGVAWLMRHHGAARQEPPGEWRNRMREVALTTHPTHDLHLWATLCDWSTVQRVPERRSLIAIAHHLPPEWWAPRAEDILTTMSDDDEGLSWMLNNPVPWAGLILREPGERHRIPCGPEVRHGGCRRTLADRLQRLVGDAETGSEGRGLEGLLDLLEALESARQGQVPRRGRTHRLIGWLAQPVDEWPEFSSEDALSGEATASVRLLSRLSGHHDDLTDMDSLTGALNRP